MDTSRYHVVDAYVAFELLDDYDSADAGGRIALLGAFLEGEVPVPFELAARAARDPHRAVRAWFARHARLFEYAGDGGGLRAALLEDPDPFVRASLRENPAAFDGSRAGESWAGHFREASHLERLALMRNRAVCGAPLVEALFDPERGDVEVGLAERRELVLAYLTNARVRRESHRASPVNTGYLWDSWECLRQRGHFSRLFRLAAKWPSASGIREAVYRHLGAEDADKAAAYRACRDPRLRAAILANCGPADTECLNLGLAD